MGELPFLTDALDAVEALAGEAEREVVVVLDEIQQIVVEHGEKAEKQIRATVQRHRHVGYIFAGSATRLLTSMATDPNRPFFRLGALTFLGPVPGPDFLAFLSEAFRSSGFAPGEGACERIVRREDPAYTQLWTSLTRNQKKTVKAVIATGGENLQSAGTSRRFGIPTASVQVALGALEDRHVLRREDREGTGRYRLVDPFLAAWLDVAQSV